MDLKALIAKMDEIESKKVLTESEDRKPSKKQEREVELPSGAKVKATKVQGWQSQKADKEADKERKKHDESMSFNSTIAKTLMREFGYDQISEAGNPWEGKDPAKAAAWAALSPQDQEWLGGADPTDKFILMRAPNKGKPAAGAATKPAEPAAAAAPTGTQAQTDDEGNTLITKPDGTTQVVGPDGKPLANGGRVQAPGATTAQPPAGGAGGPDAVAKTRARMKELIAKLGKTGGA